MAATTLNLATLDVAAAAEQGAVLELRHPVSNDVLMTGEGDDARPVTITVLGADSATWRRTMHRITNRRLFGAVGGKGRRRGRRVEIEEGASLEESIAGVAELLAECTLGWDGIALDGEDPLPFNRGNAERVYSRFQWITDQVHLFAQDRANFFSPSGNGSPPTSSTSTESAAPSPTPS